MAQTEAILVFCSSCKILDFASSVSPRIIAEWSSFVQVPKWGLTASGNKMENSGYLFRPLFVFQIT